jgi:hypothetical protein
VQDRQRSNIEQPGHGAGAEAPDHGKEKRHAGDVLGLTVVFR